MVLQDIFGLFPEHGPPRVPRREWGADQRLSTGTANCANHRRVRDWGTRTRGQRVAHAGMVWRPAQRAVVAPVLIGRVSQRSRVAMLASTVGLVMVTGRSWRWHDSVSQRVNSSRL